MRNHALAAAAAALTVALAGCSADTTTKTDAVDVDQGATQAAEPTPEETPAEPAATADDTDDLGAAAEETTSAEEPKPTKASTPTPTPEPKRKVKRYRVIDVVDGDTVKTTYAGGTSIRIIGIDTPETVHPSVPDECWGPHASAVAHRLLDGKKVRLVFDPSQGRRDYYDRILAYIKVPGIGDYGLRMIRRGNAIEYTYDTAYRLQGRYQRAERRARAADRGLWGKCGGADKPLHKPKPTPPPAPEPEPQPAGDCAPGYDPCVPPYPPDVDCADVDGPIRVTGDDPHGLDGEGDGIACES